MNEDLEKKEVPAASEEEQYSLNDDRRVKVLSPGAMVAKRFFRNRIAVVGLCILAFMFIFSFIGGIISPYKENQQFYRIDIQNKEYDPERRGHEFLLRFHLQRPEGLHQRRHKLHGGRKELCDRRRRRRFLLRRR